MHVTADERVRFDGIWSAFRFGMRPLEAATDQCHVALETKEE